jgi:transcriptional regulator with XRE-family HTH domain
MPEKFKSLADYLDAKEVTQAEFADRVGVQQSIISRIANGQRRPSLPLAIRIAAEARIPIESLLTGSESADEDVA